jgi:phthiocerol/phenolphthiocerol synthesis type-I polyketide synthase C
LLELAYHAVEDAGLALAALANKLASVYIGICNRDYSFLQLMLEARASINAYTNVGSSLCIAANRISYFFNLLGPSLAVDAACSSSLVPQPGRVDFRRSRPACSIVCTDPIAQRRRGGARNGRD